MVKYILKKIVYMIVTLWIILTATFFLMYTMPGDPTQASSKVLPEAVQENLKAKWGLDKPVTEQYVIYLKNLFQGNMGESYTTPGLTANTVIGERFPASLRLGIQAVVVGLVLGIILGVLAAFNRGKWIDFVTIFIAILGVSIPVRGWRIFSDCRVVDFRNGNCRYLPVYSASYTIRGDQRYCDIFSIYEIFGTGRARFRLYPFGEVQRAFQISDYPAAYYEKCYHTDYFYCGSSGSWYCDRFFCYRANFLGTGTWTVLCRQRQRTGLSNDSCDDIIFLHDFYRLHGRYGYSLCDCGSACP